MKRKIILLPIVFIAVLLLGLFLITQQGRSEEKVLESTYNLSKEYLLLRYRTDNILINAESYADYSSWDKDMTILVENWNNLDKQVSVLEKLASEETEKTSVNIRMVQTAHAYNSQEINSIYDKAPKFKGIAALAKHLGVDAKRAQIILDQAQAQTSSETFIEEGDAFETLENTAIVVKDGCKVAGFVGGIALTGGAAGLATAGTLTQASVVIVGADLTLEVTEDSAKIALGDKNKISSFVGDVRTVTEPIATILTITNIPSTINNAYGKFDAVMIGLEQFRDTVQEGKVVGVDLTNFEYHSPFKRLKQAKYPGTLTVAQIEKAEVEAWLQSLNKKYEPMSKEDLEKYLASSIKETKQDKEIAEKEKEDKTEPSKKNEENNTIINSAWKGTLESISGGSGEEQSTKLDFVLNKDGTVGGANFKKWKQEGDHIKLFGEDESKGYYEFKVGDNYIVLTKILIGGELIEPGQEYMGGTAPSGILYKKSSSIGGDAQSSGDAMPISEFNRMSDKGLFKNISKVIENLGEPDVKTTDDNGRIIYVYYDLVKYESGGMGSVKMAFYNEEDYKSYIKGSGASWDSNRENWDESGGGIRATEEINPRETYKQIYGE